MKSVNLGLTAELVALIKAERDPDYRHFVSLRARRLEGLLRFVLPAGTVRSIIDWRLRLSDLIDREIAADHPLQIVELGAGFSLRGLKFAMKNPEALYVESDQKNVVDTKISMINETLAEKVLSWPENYRLFAVDMIADDLSTKLKNELRTDRKTIVIAEGVTTYFDRQEFAIFLGNIGRLLSRLADARFFSHDRSRPKTAAYGLIRRILAIATGRRGHRFDKPAELSEFLSANCGCAAEVLERDGFILYSLRKNGNPPD